MARSVHPFDSPSLCLSRGTRGWLTAAGGIARAPGTDGAPEAAADEQKSGPRRERAEGKNPLRTQDEQRTAEQ